MYFLQVVDDRKIENPLRIKCMESVRRFVTEKDLYEVKEISYNPDPLKMQGETDKIRYSFARQFDDLLYVDNDCFLCALPSDDQKNGGKIIIGVDDGLHINPFLFYVNGNKEFFLNSYDKLIKPGNVVGLSSEKIDLFNGEVENYERLAYNYYSLTMLEARINAHISKINEQLETAEKEVNAYRTAIQGMLSTAELYNKIREKG